MFQVNNQVARMTKTDIVPLLFFLTLNTFCGIVCVGKFCVHCKVAWFDMAQYVKVGLSPSKKNYFYLLQ